MDIYLYISGDRVTGISGIECPGTVKMNIPDSHEVQRNPLVFRFVNGELIKDEAYQQQKIEESQKQEKSPSLKEEVESLKRQNLDLMYSLMSKGVL